MESADIQKILADQQINMEEFSVWEQHVSGGKGIRGIFHECWKKKNIEGWMKFQGPGEVYLDVVRFVFSW